MIRVLLSLNFFNNNNFFYFSARLEIVQLQQVRRLWEDLQRQIRSLHVTVRVESETTDQQPSTSGTSSSSNPPSSTSNTETQNEPAKNFKKTLIENYKRENNEAENTSPLESQPSTSGGSTSYQKTQSKSSSQSEFGNSSTNISLSNLLPSESELKRMREQSLSDLLETLQEQDSWRNPQLDELNSQPSAISDHTYSNLTTNNTTVQLPSISSFISNLTASINSPTTTQLMDSTNLTNEEVPSSSRGSKTSPSNSTQTNPGNEGVAEASNSTLLMDSPPNNASARGRQYTYQRVWRYGRRMYLRRPRLLSVGPRNMKRGSRTSFNPFRHYENYRRSMHLRKNDSRPTNGNTNNNSERSRGQNTSESLQAMIIRLESLVRQQRALARNSEMNRGSDSDSQSETTRDSPENQEMERIREVTRLRARQVLYLMVESLTQFFEENRLGSVLQSNFLFEQIYKMYVLLHLALQLTDLLLEQLVSTRRELESSQYGPFNSDLSASNPSESNERRSSGIDNGLQTEGTRSNYGSFETTEREESTRNESRDRTQPGLAQNNAEYLLSAQGSYRNMAEELRRLFHIPCCSTEQNRNEASREFESSRRPETPRLFENSPQLNRSSSLNPDSLSEGVEQSNVGHLSSENALSAEVQSIVERIQNNSRDENSERRSNRPLESDNQLETDTEPRNDLELDGDQENEAGSEDVSFQRRSVLAAAYIRTLSEMRDLQRNENEGRLQRPNWQIVTSLPIIRGPISSRRGPRRYSPLRRERLTSDLISGYHRNRPIPMMDSFLSRIRRYELHYRNRPVSDREPPVSRIPHRNEFHYYRNRPVPERDRVLSRLSHDPSFRSRPTVIDRDPLLSSASSHRHEFNVPIVQVAPPTPPPASTPPSQLMNMMLNNNEREPNNQNNSSSEQAGPSTSSTGSRNQVMLEFFILKNLLL